MTNIKGKTQEIKAILFECEKYKSNPNLISKIKKIQEAFKKETDRFGQLAKEISKKSYINPPSKSNLSESEIGFI